MLAQVLLMVRHGGQQAILTTLGLFPWPSLPPPPNTSAQVQLVA